MVERFAGGWASSLHSQRAQLAWVRRVFPGHLLNSNEQHVPQRMHSMANTPTAMTAIFLHSLLFFMDFQIRPDGVRSMLFFMDFQIRPDGIRSMLFFMDFQIRPDGTQLRKLSKRPTSQMWERLFSTINEELEPEAVVETVCETM